MAEAQTNEATQEAPPMPESMDLNEAAAFLDNLGEIPPEEQAEGQAPEEPHPSVKNLPPSPLSDEGMAEAQEAEEAQETQEEAETEESEPEAAEAAEGDDTAPDQKEPPSSEIEELADDQGDDDLPTIDPPSSLNRKQRDAFRSAPREIQQALVDIEESRMRDHRRLQNEAAEERQRLQAETKAANELKAQYEAALPNVQSMLNSEYASQFPDIATQDDVARLAAKDPGRYARWDALTKKINAVNAEAQAAEQKRQDDLKQQFSRYIQEEDAKFIAKYPEWGDAEQAPELQKAARELMEDVGYSQDEVTAFWEYGQPLSARDSRFQSLIAELVDLRGKYRKAQSALDRSKKAKKLPPVVRPGAAPTKEEASQKDLEAQYQRLAKSGRVEDAVALLSARGG